MIYQSGQSGTYAATKRTERTAGDCEPRKRKSVAGRRRKKSSAKLIMVRHCLGSHRRNFRILKLKLVLGPSVIFKKRKMSLLAKAARTTRPRNMRGTLRDGTRRRVVTRKTLGPRAFLPKHPSRTRSSWLNTASS